MDHISPKDKDTKVDLESGLLANEDDSTKVCSPDSAKQTKSPIAKLLGGILGGSVKGEDQPSLQCNEPNLNGVPTVDVMKVANMPLAGQDSVNHVNKIPVKEKRKKSSNKKAAKPPRPPRGPTLDAADLILIREISELAMFKRARIERMKALKKMKAAKASSSSSCGSIFAIILTIIFCIAIIYQGVSSGKNPVQIFQGSPLSPSGTDGSLIQVQNHINPSATESNAPVSDFGSESPNSVQQVAGSDFPENLKRGAR